MKTLITGGNGFLGRKLAQRLLADGGHEVLLLDVVPGGPVPTGAETLHGDINEAAVQECVRDLAPDNIVHLAAVVSAAAEADFDLGMRVNVDGTRALLDVCRVLRKPPKLVFASSVAVFGHAPPVVEDETPARPQSSYGTQKAIGELLVNDYSRKGFVHGCALRLPTVVVRPGRPNAAASSFASSIIREPLNGDRAVCPVPLSLPLWLSSPRAVVDNLLRALAMAPDAWEDDRIINLPGITATVGGMIDALERAGGDRELIDHVPDARIAGIVGTWPGGMRTTRADALGFGHDADIDAIVRAYIDDDLSH